MSGSFYHPLATFAAAGALACHPTARTNSAVSREACAVHDNAIDASSHYESSEALFGQTANALESLLNIAQECVEDNWDGFGAIAADPMAIRRAESFIRALPPQLPNPEVSVDPDGEISLDWIPSQTQTFTLSISGGSRVSYAWIDGTNGGHASEDFKNDVISERIVSELKRIAESGFAVWLS